MSNFDSSMEPMLEMFIFESTSLLTQLDEILLKTEKSKLFTLEDINEIFRIMHTIKGSSAMMGVENIASIAHSVEDMFFVIRENTDKASQDSDTLFELVFQASDFMTQEMEKIQNDQPADGVCEELKGNLKLFTNKLTGLEETPNLSDKDTTPEQSKDIDLSNLMTVKVTFQDGCKMENLRAFMIVNKLKDHCEHLIFSPNDIETNSNSSAVILEQGFIISFKNNNTTTDEEILQMIENSMNVDHYILIENSRNSEIPKEPTATKEPSASTIQDVNASLVQTKDIAPTATKQQSIISVNLQKLNELMDIVGEIVITESMVTSSPDLKGLLLDNFQKSARQLRKLTDELQNIAMSIRMVPVSTTFNKMQRIVRDVCKKLDKKADLILIGEETEVDKTIIDNLSDPLMHMIRNAMDHAIEMPEERAAVGKNETGQVVLCAHNTGGEVIITISDDGRGLCTEKILAKAKANGLLSKDESEYSEKEVFNMIMLPGFSTKESVTEFSGRGVGMDVVKKNIEKVGGIVTVESKLGVGTNFLIKIPLTLAIIDGMEISVGHSIYTLPINTIKEAFKVTAEQVIKDTENSEMIMIREQCYPVIRLHDLYSIHTQVTNLEDGIVIMVESEEKTACLFVDKLIGEQKVVVKPLPVYLNQFNIKENGISGCTILGDGSISLILDIQGIINMF